LEVKIAESFAEALSLARTEEFDLFVLDGRYPKGEGADLCRQLRQMKPETLVVFYSGAALEHDREQGISAGANAYISKPEVEGLLAAVRRLLQQSSRVASD
jgi:DNA-binding response OmpR family regulator